jgi:hypothetical protein
MGRQLLGELPKAGQKVAIGAGLARQLKQGRAEKLAQGKGRTPNAT